MSAKVDGSDCTWLAYCEDCQWYWLALDPQRAYDAAAGHERAVHPEQRAARMAARRWRDRNAA